MTFRRTVPWDGTGLRGRDQGPEGWIRAHWDRSGPVADSAAEVATGRRGVVGGASLQRIFLSVHTRTLEINNCFRDNLDSYMPVLDLCLRIELFY